MHLVPELLYRLTTRDTGQPWARVVFPRAANTAALAVMNTAVRNELDRVLVVTNLWGSGTPGAAQTLTLLTFQVVDGSATFSRNVSTERFTLAAATAGFLNWQGELMLPPGWFLRLDAVFSAGAAANALQLDAAGCAIPQGTILLP